MSSDREGRIAGLATRLRRLPLADVGGPTLGYAVVGLSAFVLLASGPRLLGPSTYSLLAVTWTVATIIGLGIAFPGEQTITRVLASHGDLSVVRNVERRLSGLAAVTAMLPVLALLGYGPLLDSSVLWSTSLAVYVAGWAALASARGRLAGVRDFAAYTMTLIADGVARIAFCIAAWLLPDAAAVLLASAVGVPLLLAAALGFARAHHVDRHAKNSLGDTHWREQSLITAVAVLSQLALNSAPLWIQAKAGQPALAGEFVTTTSYLRIPMLLVGGLTAVALSTTSSAVGQGDRDRATSIARRSVLTVLGLGVVATGLLLLAAPLGLRILYGGPVSLSPGTQFALAAGTVLAMVAGLVTVLAFGCSRSLSAAVTWSIVAVLVTLGLAASSGVPMAVAGVTALGQMLAAVVLGLLVRRSLNALPARPQDSRSGDR